MPLHQWANNNKRGQIGLAPLRENKKPLFTSGDALLVEEVYQRNK